MFDSFPNPVFFFLAIFALVCATNLFAKAIADSHRRARAREENQIPVLEEEELKPPRLKPSVSEMLYIGDGLGAANIAEAYEEYLLHHDLFFDLAYYGEQRRGLLMDLVAYGFVVDGQLVDMTIVDAKEHMESVDHANS